MNSSNANTLSRRSILQRSGLGVASLGLAKLIEGSNAIASESERISKPHFTPRAKRVVHIFLNGGSSQVDTFDPKPTLKKFADRSVTDNLATERKTGAAFPSPFRFRKHGESGIEVSELFEQTAKHIDDIAVIRSMYAEVPNHEPSLMLMNCGNSIQSRPSFGSWLLYGLGSENQNLPGFIAMCPNGLPIKDNENWQSSFLPGSLQGTYVDSQHEQLSRLIENIEHSHISKENQRRQLDLLSTWNQRHLARHADPRMESRIESYELAFRMQGDAAEAFDISREPKYVINKYGSGVHARQTLIARRLLERGVRFVQLWHGAGQPWDNHSEIEKEHRKLSKQIDQPVAALLSDLKERGMLEETLVLFGGEFGRTPTVELNAKGEPINGRDHNHYGFSVWLAGGGIKGGTVYGSTDELGFRAAENPMSVHDLHATMLHLLGLDHKRLTYRYAGRDYRLTDVHGNIVNDIIA